MVLRLFGGAGVLAMLGLALPLLAADIAAILKPTTDFSRPEPYERHPGGATSQDKTGGNAFSLPAANLSFEQRADFFVGNGFFKRLWSARRPRPRRPMGLGPLYNARSCQRCHLKGGRGHPPAGADDSAVSMFLRLSVPQRTDAERELLAAHRKAVILAIAMQYEGSKRDRVPLVGLFDGSRVRLLQAPDGVQRQMRQYCDSMAVDRGGGVIGVSAPRGNLVAFCDADGTYLTAHPTGAASRLPSSPACF